MAQHRHKRETNARRIPRIPRIPRAALVAAPIAVVATASAVTLGVVANQPDAGRDLMATSGFQASVGGSAARGAVVTRGSSRMAKAEKQIDAARHEIKATNTAVRNADTELWTTEELNLWSGPGQVDVQLGVVEPGKQVLVTGRERSGREEIVFDGEARWISGGFLDDEKPLPGIGGSCSNGSSVSSGVSPNISEVHNAVCAVFPQITSYGTFRGDGEHAQGRAVDIMISGATGWDVANFVRSHYSELGVEYIIFSQNIWSVERGGEGWRGMSDRGSTTANHYDHVHVTTY